MSRIQYIKARQILDSRGIPTLEVQVSTAKGIGVASVPSGASKGAHEAPELRDGGKAYGGLGVQKAIRNVGYLSTLLNGKNILDQSKIDSLLFQHDGARIYGANTLLGISLACARAAAFTKKEELFEHLGTLNRTKRLGLPLPFVNVLNGGKHARGGLAIQEIMIVPIKARTFSHATQMVAEVYMRLRQRLHNLGHPTLVGDEGGFCPRFIRAEQALDLLIKSIADAGYTGKIAFAIDAAASEFFMEGKYHLHKAFTAKELSAYYLSLIKRYPLVSLEDPFDQDDLGAFKDLKQKCPIQLVGDDLLVTDTARIKSAKDCCGALLLKANQVGTLTQALQAAKLAYDYGWNVMVSHRSGETNDVFIADLAVGLGCGQIKLGAPCRGERVAKFNRLLQIEQEHELSLINTL